MRLRPQKRITTKTTLHIKPEELAAMLRLTKQVIPAGTPRLYVGFEGDAMTLIWEEEKNVTCE